jgi:hypothetical protein
VLRPKRSFDRSYLWRRRRRAIGQNQLPKRSFDRTIVDSESSRPACTPIKISAQHFLFMSMPPSLARQMSIGAANFAQNLAEGQQAAAEGDIHHPADGDNEEPEWLSGHNATFLQPVPAESQEDVISDDGNGDDDRKLELLNGQYVDLNSKTFRMKDLLTKKAGLLNKAGADSYELMATMHDTIDGMEDGEEKANDCAMYNAIFTLYESARKNERLLYFVSDVFGGLREKHDTKEEKLAIDTEYKMLTKLYDEQEEKQVFEKLAEKRAARKAALAMKAEEKAKKLEAKEASKAEASATKKQKK